MVKQALNKIKKVRKKKRKKKKKDNNNKEKEKEKEKVHEIVHTLRLRAQLQQMHQYGKVLLVSLFCFEQRVEVFYLNKAFVSIF